MEMKFYRCSKCGQIVAVVKKTSSPIICCGEEMSEIVAGSVDASKEKHVPIVIRDSEKVTVKVGSAEHPMEEKHYIEWVAIQTKEGNQRKALSPGDKPEICFKVCQKDELIAVYAYCNLHGLWKANC